MCIVEGRLLRTCINNQTCETCHLHHIQHAPFFSLHNCSPATGKTAVVRAVLEASSKRQAYASCTEVHSPRVLFEGLLNTLKGEHPDSSKLLASRSLACSPKRSCSARAFSLLCAIVDFSTAGCFFAGCIFLSNVYFFTPPRPPPLPSPSCSVLIIPSLSFVLPPNPLPLPLSSPSPSVVKARATAAQRGAIRCTRLFSSWTNC